MDDAAVKAARDELHHFATGFTEALTRMQNEMSDLKRLITALRRDVDELLKPL